MNRFEDAIQAHRKTTIEAQARQDADAADLRYPEEGSKEPDWLADSVRPLALLMACLLAGCGADAVSTAPTDNSQIKVERLFDHDGCTVYRFYDSRKRYFVKCRDKSTRTEWSESY